MIDGDSVTINNLRNSANMTFVTVDDYLTFTATWDKHRKFSQEEFFCQYSMTSFVKEKAIKKNVW